MIAAAANCVRRRIGTGLLFAARMSLRIFAGLAFACAGAVAHADDFKLGDDPVTNILKWRPTTPDPEVKDFVRESRPAGDLKYAPLSGPKAERPPLKSKKDLKAMVDGMDGRAAALRRRGGGTATAGNATARQLQAAAAESRRRAAEAFGTAPAAK